MPADDQKKPEYGQGRIAFIALRDEIRSDVERGRTLMSIYRDHQKAVGVSYKHFARLAQRYLDVVPIHRRRIETTGKIQSRPALGQAASGSPLGESQATTIAPAERPSAAVPPSPPRGSKEWRELHGIPDPDAPKKPVFVARIPDLDRLAFGDGEPEK